MADPASAPLRTARSMAVVGLVCGALYAFGGLIYDLSTTGPNLGTALAFLALVGMPVGFGLAGFLVVVVARAVLRLITGTGAGSDAG